MSNNKQSSLDFYRKNLHSMVSGGSTEFKTEVEIFEQAKAMHKEEIIQAWKKGDGIFDNVAKQMSLEYYNETFGGDNEQQ